MRKAEKKILTAINKNIASDIDVKAFADDVSSHFEKLLALCDVEATAKRDAYTRELAWAYAVFRTCPELGIGTAREEYIAHDAAAAFRGYKIRLKDTAEAKALMEDIKAMVSVKANDPEEVMRWLKEGGVF